jgi:tetratricopeptide (TPR) repeat protein
MKILGDSNIVLPATGPEHDGVRASLRVLHALLEPTFNVREENITDLGVDGMIEVGRYDPATGNRIWTNLRAYFQIKHASKPRFLSDKSLSFSIEVKNLNYLNSRQLPALYLVLDYPTDTLYMRWHRHILQELERTNPTWNTQKTIDVHFRDVVNKDSLIGIEAEIRAHAEMVSSLDDGPGILRNFLADRLPDSLVPHYPFVGRQQEIRTLEAQMTSNSITSVSGRSGTGKTELVAHFVSNREIISEISKTFPKPLALLLVDLYPQIGVHSVLRNLAYALGVSKLSALSEVDWDEVASEAYVKTLLVSQALPSRLRGQSVLAVFENSQRVFEEPLEFQELDEILAADIFRDGAVIIICYQESPITGQARRILAPSVHLQNLSPAEAEELLSKVIRDTGLATSAIDIVRSIPEVLVPGAIMRGVGIFNRRVSRHEPSSAENLAEAIVYAYEPLVKDLLEEIGVEGDFDIWELSGFYALGVMALFGSLGVNDDLLDQAALQLPQLDSLSEKKWILRSGGGYQLTEVAQFVIKNEIRLAFSDVSRQGVRIVLRAAISRFIDALERRTLQDERSQRSVEEALTSIKRLAPDERELQDRLTKLLLPYVVDDLIFPFSKTESTELRERLQEVDDSKDLESKVAQLVTSSRWEVDAASFLKQFRQTIKLSATSAQLSSRHVRALDIAASIFTRHHNLDSEIIKIRRQLITRLFLKANQDNYEDTNWIKWASSWALNTVDLLIASGQLSEVHRLLEDITGLLERLPPPSTQQELLDVSQLWGRVKRLEAKLASDPTERILKLREALSFATEVVSFSKNQEQAIRLYLRAVRRLVDELRTDEERTENVEKGLNEIAILYGERQRWPLHVASASAALIRHEASLHTNPDRRLERIQSAISLLAPLKSEALSRASQGDIRSLLTLARCYAFLSVTNEKLGRAQESLKSFEEAKELSRKAIEHFPSSEAWILLLKLQDQEDHSSLPRVSSNTMTIARRNISPALQKLMKRGMVWANAVLNRGVNEGKLILWCLEREWSNEGSLERHAANSPDLEKNWTVLKASRKAEIITAIYSERQRRLDEITRRFGAFRDLFLARATNEAQYQRFIALQSTHQFNTAAVLAILEAASSVWRDDPLIVAEEGRLHRLVWNYAEAITSFRRVRTMSADSELRREVTVILIETLLSASIHLDILHFSDGVSESSSELVKEAQSVLPDVVEFQNVVLEASVLRDRVEFEAGGEIDWPAIDSAYEMVIGGVDGYLDTIVRNLDELLLERPDLPKNLAEVVKQNCTSIEVLQGMGSLYLRRAETGRGDTPVQDCERAYAAFNACRILERSWFGSELPLTTFRRARAILIAAFQANDSDPFQVYLGKRKTSLDLAESLLESVISKSIGGFYSVAKQRREDLRALRRRLKERANSDLNVES